ncbi:MAG: succinoglycan biosynthesis transport protein ExoP [Rhodothermales bacterium]
MSPREILRKLHRKRWLGLMVCAVIWGIAVAVMVFVPSRYNSSTILLLDTALMEQTVQQYANADDVISAFGLPKVANQAALLRSVPEIAENAATRMLTDLGPAELAPLPYQAPDKLAEWLRETAIVITSEAGKDQADLIRIEATAPGPMLAAAISTTYSDSYMTLMREAVARQRESALAQQRARVEDVVNELNGLDEQLRLFWQENGGVSIEQDAQLAGSRISDLQISLDNARISYSTHSATLESLEEELGDMDLESLADRVASSVESEIAATQLQLTSTELILEQFYSKTPALRANPESSEQVLKLVTDVAGMRERLDILSERFVNEVMATGGVDLARDPEGRAYVLGLRRQIAQERVAKRAAEAQISAINSRLAAFQNSRTRYSEQSVSLTQIQRGRQLADDHLKTEIDRLGDIQVNQPADFVKRIQAAVAPSNPAFPNAKLVVIGGFLLGILLGGGVAYGWAAIDGSVHEAEDLAGFGIPVRGTLPDLSRVVRKLAGREAQVNVGSRMVSSHLVVIHAPQAAEAALIRKYALGLVARTPSGGTILFTSADMGAGKTTLTANVGAALGLAGFRVLVIDADIFRPGQMETLGLTSRSALDVETGSFGPGGGVEQLGGMMQLLFGLTLRARIPADAEAQTAQAAVHLAQFYGQHFDYVLIDSPPTSASSIAASIGRFAHSRILVIGAGKTPRELVAMSLSELQSMGASPTEMAINRLDMSAPTAARKAYQQAEAYYSGLESG